VKRVQQVTNSLCQTHIHCFNRNFKKLGITNKLSTSHNHQTQTAAPGIPPCIIQKEEESKFSLSQWCLFHFDLDTAEKRQSVSSVVQKGGSQNVGGTSYMANGEVISNKTTVRWAFWGVRSGM
jgi:hypothetical protein